MPKFCAALKNEFQNIIPPDIEKIRGHFLLYKKEGNNEALEYIETAYNVMGEYKERYTRFAMEIMHKWCNFLSVEERDRFLEALFFDESGRVVIKKNYIRVTKYEKYSYFPKIIRKIEGNLDCYETVITSFDFLEEVTGYFNVNRGEIFSCERLRKVGSSFSCDSTKNLQSLENLEEVGEYLSCVDSSIRTVRALKRVGKSANFAGSKIESCPQLETIGQDLDIKRTAIRSIEDFRKTFPKLKQVGYIPFDPKGIYISPMYVSIFLSPEQVGLKKELESLVQKGDLTMSGEVYVYSPYDTL